MDYIRFYIRRPVWCRLHQNAGSTLCKHRHIAVHSKDLTATIRARGMSAIARKAGLGRENFYKALAPDGNPQLSTVPGVLLEPQPGTRRMFLSPGTAVSIPLDEFFRKANG